MVVAGFALCAALAACAGPPVEKPAPSDTAQANRGMTERVMPESSPEQPAKSETDPVRRQELAALTGPAALDGMTRERVSHLFGEPVFVRRDPPAEFWRYRSRNCLLELYFYERGGRMQVRHVDLRSPVNGGVTPGPECVRALAASHTG